MSAFLDDYIRAVNAKIYLNKEKRGGLRKGQILYNILHSMCPEIAVMIQGTNCDPFYDDAVIPDFMAEVFGETYRNLFSDRSAK